VSRSRNAEDGRASTQGALPPPGGEVVDAGTNGALQCREALAVEHRGEVGPSERELAHGSLEIHVHDLPAGVGLPQSVAEVDIVVVRAPDPGAHDRRAARSDVLPEDLEALVRPAIEVRRVVGDRELPEQLAPARALRVGQLLPPAAEGPL